MTARPITDESREAAAHWCLRLAEGPLELDERQAFHAWLESDADHAELFEQTVIAWDAIEDQASDPEVIVWRGAALDAVAREARRRWAPIRQGARGWMALAAALVVVIALGGLWWWLAPTEFSTEQGERRFVALPDGSQVALDGATTIRMRYRPDGRQFWLDRGRARFTVAKNPLRPLSVEVGDRIVVATGTAFSVERLADQVRVVLHEGRVAVLAGADTRRPLAIGPRRASAEEALRPGGELVMAGNAPARIEPAPAGTAGDWTTGLLAFDEEPLGVAVERMNRLGRTLLRAEGSAAALPISGQFSGNDSDAFVEGVTAVFALDAIRAEDGAIVLRRRATAPPK